MSIHFLSSQTAKRVDLKHSWIVSLEICLATENSKRKIEIEEIKVANLRFFCSVLHFLGNQTIKRDRESTLGFTREK